MPQDRKPLTKEADRPAAALTLLTHARAVPVQQTHVRIVTVHSCAHVPPNMNGIRGMLAFVPPVTMALCRACLHGRACRVSHLLRVEMPSEMLRFKGIGASPVWVKPELPSRVAALAVVATRAHLLLQDSTSTQHMQQYVARTSHREHTTALSLSKKEQAKSVKLQLLLQGLCAHFSMLEACRPKHHGQPSVS